MGLFDFTFYDIIRRNAACFGDRCAWFEAEENRTWTFKGYKEMVDRLAFSLSEAGLQKGDRVGVFGKNSLAYFVLYGAAAALGAVMLPINWRLSADEAKFNLSDCSPKIVFADPEYHDLVTELKNDLPSVKRLFSLAEGSGAFAAFDDLMAYGGELNTGRMDVAGDDGFVIIHTAAVAGRPRGALLSHTNLMCANVHFNYHLRMSPEDVHLNLLPLFHVGGFFMATSAFHAGALNVNMSKFDPEKAVVLIKEKRVSILFEFSPILSAILDACEKSGGNIGCLRTVAGLDTSETIERYQQATGGDFYCLYGQTETSGLATIGRYTDRPGAAGKGVLLADVRIADENDRLVPTGEIGEITVKGPLIFKGYWNLPEENARTFRHGWHHSGDLGRFDADGYLWYAGRKAEKELIKPGGENVYPVEVENVLLMHPAVESAVVFGVPDPMWKEAVKAVCRLKPGQTLDAGELKDFVGSRIARYKKPQTIQFVEELPLLKNGVPDREKIKQLYGESERSTDSS